MSLFKDYRTKRLGKQEARKKIAEIIKKSPENVRFSRHAEVELTKDGLSNVDAWNVLKSTSARIYVEGEWEKESYRYRLETDFLLVVVAFWPDGKGLNIVTAWDKRK